MNEPKSDEGSEFLLDESVRARLDALFARCHAEGFADRLHEKNILPDEAAMYLALGSFMDQLDVEDAVSFTMVDLANEVALTIPEESECEARRIFFLTAPVFAVLLSDRAKKDGISREEKLLVMITLSCYCMLGVPTAKSVHRVVRKFKKTIPEFFAEVFLPERLRPLFHRMLATLVDSVSLLKLMPEEGKDPAADEAWDRAIQRMWRGSGLAPFRHRVTESTTGRNDPCPCGSGKKYKRCCLGRKAN